MSIWFTAVVLHTWNVLLRSSTAIKIAQFTAILNDFLVFSLSKFFEFLSFGMDFRKR